MSHSPCKIEIRLSCFWHCSTGSEQHLRHIAEMLTGLQEHELPPSLIQEFDFGKILQSILLQINKVPADDTTTAVWCTATLFDIINALIRLAGKQ